MSVLGGACLTYFLLIFSPEISAGTHLSRARHDREMFDEAVRQVPRTVLPAAKTALLQETVKLHLAVNGELDQARKASPGNVRPLLESAAWALVLAQASSRLEQGQRAVDRLQENASRALDFVEQARQLDPLGEEEPLLESHIRLQLEFELAQALFVRLKEPAKGRVHAENAIRLDQEAEESGRTGMARLTPEQRKQLRKWLGESK